MIGILFTLTGVLIFAISIAVMDCLIIIVREFEEAEKHFGHDTDIFPDHEHEHEHES